MPNWCMNTLSVVGNEVSIASFKGLAKTKESDFSFAPFLPPPKEYDGMKTGFNKIDGVEFTTWRDVNGKDVGIPKAELQEIQRRTGYTGWYDRNCAVLGTKWDVSGTLDKEHTTKKQLQYQFDSAWSPPVEGIVAISRQYPNCTFTLIYDEPGMNFGGTLVVKSGKILELVERDSEIDLND